MITSHYADTLPAKFLYNLGLQRFPSLQVILGLAASPDQKVRTVALRYFLDNLAMKYVDYDPNNFSQIAFVPAVKDHKPYMAKPSEVSSAHYVPTSGREHSLFQVYASSEWTSLGFPTVDPSLKADALTKLKIREHPPTAELVNLLQKTPPANDAIAREWFAVLAGRIAGSFMTRDPRLLLTSHRVHAGSAEDALSNAHHPSYSYR